MPRPVAHIEIEGDQIAITFFDYESFLRSQRLLNDNSAKVTILEDRAFAWLIDERRNGNEG